MPVDTDWHLFIRVLPARRQLPSFMQAACHLDAKEPPTCLYYGEAEHAMLHLSTSPEPP